MVRAWPFEQLLEVVQGTLGGLPTPNVVTLGHLWYNLGPHFVGLISAAQSGTTNYQDVQARPALGLTSGSPHILTTIQSMHFYKMGPNLS